MHQNTGTQSSQQIRAHLQKYLCFHKTQILCLSEQWHGKKCDESLRLNCCYTVAITIVTFIKSEQPAKNLVLKNM